MSHTLTIEATLPDGRIVLAELHSDGVNDDEEPTATLMSPHGRQDFFPVKLAARAWITDDDEEEA